MRRKIIIGIGFLIALAVSGLYGLRLYGNYCKQMEVWNEVAKATFDEALWMEMDKRSKVPIFHYSSEQQGTVSLNTRMPDSISVKSSAGFRRYKFDRCKYELSLIKETDKRAMLTTLLSMYPLSIDTLAIHWDSLLVSNSIPIKSSIRYIYTDENLQNDTILSSVSKLSFDSLNVRYLGFRNEHELVAYVVYPFWVSSLSLMEWLLLILPWGLFILLVPFYTSFENYIQKIFFCEKVIEKEIHVADVKIGDAKIFLLPDGSLFDSFSGVLSKGEFSRQLPPQSIILLKLFLRKENHSLSSLEIEQELWDGKGSADRLHKAIQRLRADLKNVSSDVVIKKVNGDYELKSSISSNKIGQMEN